MEALNRGALAGMILETKETRFTDLKGSYFDFVEEGRPGRERLIALSPLENAKQECAVIKLWSEDNSINFTEAEAKSGRLGSGLAGTYLKSILESLKFKS